MTQKSLAEQIAEMKNNLVALDKLMQAEMSAPKIAVVRKKITSIKVQYSDETEETFVPENKQLTQIETLTNTTPKSRRQIIYTGVHNNWALRSKFKRVGVKVKINGVEYPSMAEASRQLNLHPCTVRDRVRDPLFKDWNLV